MVVVVVEVLPERTVCAGAGAASTALLEVECGDVWGVDAAAGGVTEVVTTSVSVTAVGLAAATGTMDTCVAVVADVSVWTTTTDVVVAETDTTVSVFAGEDTLVVSVTVWTLVVVLVGVSPVKEVDAPPSMGTTE